MPWAQRGPHKYYYRSVRQGRHVTKEYLGTGPLAELSAAEDAERRVQRQAEAEAWQHACAEMDAMDSQLEAWWDAGTVLLKATLYIEGYYQHDRGTWRKRAHP